MLVMTLEKRGWQKVMSCERAAAYKKYKEKVLKQSGVNHVSVNAEVPAILLFSLPKKEIILLRLRSLFFV